MFASISHETRTPINVIMNSFRCLSTLQDLRFNSNIMKWVKIGYASCKHMLSMINDTLDYTMLKVGKMQMNFKEENLVEFFSEI